MVTITSGCVLVSASTETGSAASPAARSLLVRLAGDDACELVLMSLCCDAQHVMVVSTLPQYNSEEEEQDRRVRRGRERERGGGREISSFTGGLWVKRLDS